MRGELKEVREREAQASDALARQEEERCVSDSMHHQVTMTCCVCIIHVVGTPLFDPLLYISRDNNIICAHM